MKIEKLNPQDRHDLIIEDITSMVKAYNMGDGECAAIFLAFAARHTISGGVDPGTYREWAEQAWVTESVRQIEQAIVQRVPGNGLFK